MNTNPVVVKRTFDAPIEKVWSALTVYELMKMWYFDIPGFKAEKGYKFQFMGGPEDGVQYLHLCEITDVIPGKKLTYSWRYDGYEGISYVTFELTAEGDRTTLFLSHIGLESFPASNPDFAMGNFAEGWNHIVNIGLKDFLQNI